MHVIDNNAGKLFDLPYSLLFEILLLYSVSIKHHLVCAWKYLPLPYQL